MLSTQTSSLQQRQRQHRRQNSTPTAFDAPKVPLLPATAIRRNGSHRRGLSLDQRPHQRNQPKQFPQDDRTVSTNIGLHQQQQHILQETQQQRLARPGPQQNTKYRLNHGQDCAIGPQPQQLAPFLGTGLPNDTLCKETNIVINTNKDSGNRLVGDTHITHSFSTIDSRDFDKYLEILGIGQDGGIGLEALGEEKPSPNGKIETFGDNETYMLHPECNAKQLQPSTPPDKSSSGKPTAHSDRRTNQLKGTVYFPMTPATTPSNRKEYTASKNWTAQPLLNKRPASDISRASASKAIRRGTSCTDVFDGWTLQADDHVPPSPPNTAPLMSSTTFDAAPSTSSSFEDGRGLKMEFTSSDTGYNSSYYSPMSHALSPTISSFQSSPDLAYASLMANPTRGLPDLAAPSQTYPLQISQSSVSLGNYSSQVRDALPPRAMSISELNLDASMDVSIEDTGVTIDEIASFIQGPDPYDGKWICLYLDCNKKFGRKENIKSHVQTHLGDRQFRCNHCRKCFVRQHDLKRHSKIHSGVKPYPCKCGNSFARHDALTRHRQRGMCIGAFEGIVKKQVKRGRPKKARPELDERLDKAERSRRGAVQKFYASSSSGWSESSFPASPPLELDNLSIRGSSPFDNFQNLPCDSLGADVFTYTPPMSPGYSTGNCVSPQQTQHCYTRKELSSSPKVKPTLMTSIAEEAQGYASKPRSPSHTAASRAETPPELCLTSSSPPACKFFDFEASSEAESNISRSITDSTNRATAGGMEFPAVSGSMDDLFLDPNFGTDDDSLTALERDPGMLLMGKFEDPFSGDDLFSDPFTHSSDGFFGSP